jgi:hypothetical protein
MTEIVLVLAFGILAIICVTAFGWRKLKLTCLDIACILKAEKQDFCDRMARCDTLREINAEFLERRNEFWFGLCQIIIIVVMVTVLAVLLILEKISPEAAMPVIAGLGSFALGKGIMGAKNKIAIGTKPDTNPEKQEERK